MTTDPTPDRAHRATFTVTVTSRPDGGHYLDGGDFAAHVAQWIKIDLRGHHAVAEVTATAAPSAAVSPPPATDRAGLRDRIRRVLCEFDGKDYLWGTDMLEPDEYGDQADAVLSVLPPAADRAAVLREVEAAEATEAQPETPLEKRLRYSERRNDELRAECKRRGKRVLEQSEKIIALEQQLDEVRRQLGAEILRAGQAETELRRLAAGERDEQQAHPAEHTWTAELRDPLAEEWAPGTRYVVRERAVDALAHARRLAPTWTDGTPTERRLVRATTTYTVETDAAAPVAGQPPAAIETPPGMLRPRLTSRPGDATVDPAMCPRCKGDNSEAFELCADCATEQPPADTGEEADARCVCGHTRGKHVIVGGPFGRGRLLCDECNGLDGSACKEFEAL